MWVIANIFLMDFDSYAETSLCRAVCSSHIIFNNFHIVWFDTHIVIYHIYLIKLETTHTSRKTSTLITPNKGI